MKFITRNPTLKVISLILAVILWLFVKSKSESEVGLTVPVEFFRVPSSLVVTQVSEDAINVRIVGPFSQLERFPLKEGRARIDLSGAKAGTNTFEILPHYFNIPKAFTITQISPSSVKVELDHVMEKVVHVKSAVKGRPAKGYRVAKIAVDPPFVNLQGARSQLASFREVLTEEIDISGLGETLQVEVPLKLDALKLKEGVRRSVKVNVFVQREPGPR